RRHERTNFVFYVKGDGQLLNKASSFRYLGSIITEDGTITLDSKARIAASWAKWRELKSILCDRKLPLKFKSKIYRSMVRPVAMYGTESWPSTVTDEHSMETTEMRMLRWAYGVTLYDRLRSENIRVAIGVAPLSGKIREARLRWYGHVQRADSCSVAGIAFNLRIPGPKPV